MVRTSCGRSPSSATAVFSAFRTPKSPQPGHQSGSTLPLKSLTVTRGLAGGCWPVFEILASISTVSTLIVHSLNHDFMDRYIFLRCARQNLFNAIDNMMRHKRLAIIFPNMAVGDDAGFGPQITRELAAVVIFDNDDF